MLWLVGVGQLSRSDWYVNTNCIVYVSGSCGILVCSPINSLCLVADEREARLVGGSSSQFCSP